MIALRDHPKRLALNNEVHARPPFRLPCPSRLSYIAWITPGDAGEIEYGRLQRLLSSYRVDAPGPEARHFRADLGEMELTWERHTEFTRLTLVVPGAPARPFADNAVDLLPDGWLEAESLQVLAATNLVCMETDAQPTRFEHLADEYFDGHVLIGASIAGGAATAVTDARIRQNGFSRLLLLNQSMPPQQGGRMAARLLEIETYRLMTLLALPVAQSLGPFLDVGERELVQVGDSLAATRAINERDLLDKLTKLEAQSESLQLQTGFRFSAAEAYYELVTQRIDELREVRIPGLQTYAEFTRRRLAPAVNTCRAVARRHVALSARMSRLTGLLSTRVDIARQHQNQQLLQSMNKRAARQLRLQQTVEGLSIAAISYYVIGLLAYVFTGMGDLGLPVNKQLAVAVSVPLVVVGVALIIRRLRESLDDEALENDS